MTTYVLVHGGGHGGWCYSKVKHLLEAEGHVFAPSLTGLAERSGSLSTDIDLDTHIDDIVRVAVLLGPARCRPGWATATAAW